MSESSGETKRLRRGDVVEVEIDSIAQGGDAFARLDGMALFLDRGLPGERVRARLEKAKRRHGRARVIEVLAARPDAQASGCAVSDRCGGCRFWRASYQDEVLWKSSAAVSAVERIGRGITWPAPEVVPAPEVTGYRNRARYRAADAEGGSGFLEAGSRNVVATERCAVVHPAIEAVRRPGMAFFAGLPGLESVFFEWDAEQAGVAVTGEFSLRSMTPGLRTVRERVSRHKGRRLDEFTTIVVSASGRHHTIIGDGLVWRRRGERESVVVKDPVTSFSQAYDLMNVELIRRVVDGAGNPARYGQSPNITELFAGSGNLTFPLVEAGFNVDAIEGAAGPVQAAANAYKDSPLSTAEQRVRFHVADLSMPLQGHLGARLQEANVIVTDPPRGGMKAELVAQLCHVPAQTMVYVSCDPPAMARDVAALCQDGRWQVDRWSLADMFPRTPHIEAITVLRRV